MLVKMNGGIRDDEIHIVSVCVNQAVVFLNLICFHVCYLMLIYDSNTIELSVGLSMGRYATFWNHRT